MTLEVKEKRMRILNLLLAGLICFAASHVAWAKSPPQNEADIDEFSAAAKVVKDDHEPASEDGPALGGDHSAESSTAPLTLADVPPARTVRGRKGPLELILRVYKDQFRVGEFIWIQLEAVNVSTQPLTIYGKAFRDFGGWNRVDLMDNSGAYVEVRDMKGRAYPSYPTFFNPCPESGKYLYMSEKEELELYAMVEEWDKQGVPLEQQQRRIEEYENQRSEERFRKSLFADLDPGESITTEPCPSSAFEGYGYRLVPYTQLGGFKLDVPGDVKIRGIYDWSGSSYAEAKDGPKRVATPWVKMKVVP